jgi:hypothetical protein
LPEPAIDEILAGATPTVDHLRQLHASSQASEEVCAIALASRLPVRGAVVLIRRRTATVAFAAGNGWPPLRVPRGLAVPSRHPLRDLGTRQRWTGWTTADFRLALAEHPMTSLAPHSAEELLHTDALAGPLRTAAILLDSSNTHEDINRNLTGGYVSSQEPGSAQLAHSCLICGNSAPSDNYPCDECAVAPCSRCGRCRCF